METIAVGCAGYLAPIYRDPKGYADLIARTAKRVKALRRQLKFDGLAYRGNSGAAVVCPVAAMLALPMVYVRKPDEKCHSGNGKYDPGVAVPSTRIEGPTFPVKSVLIVDDLIASGETIREIERACGKYGIRVAGILLWLDPGCDSAWICVDGSEVLRTYVQKVK